MVSFLAVLLLAAQHARADFSQDAYSDAKDIIVELIERDVAESVSADLACYSPEGLLKYFPKSLQAVFDRNMGAIRDQLQRETVSFVANYAFECFRQKRTIPLSQFLPVSGFNPNDATANQCRSRVIEAGGPADYAAKAEAYAAAQHINFLPIQRCENPELEAPDVRALCPFVAALRAVTSGTPKDSLKVFAEAAASISFNEWTSFLRNNLKQTSNAKLPSSHYDADHAEAAIFEELLSRLSTGHYDTAGLLATLDDRDFSDALKLLDTIPSLEPAPDVVASDTSFEVIFAATSPRIRRHAGAIRLLLKPAPSFEITVNGAKVSQPLIVLRSLVQDAPGSAPEQVPGASLALRLLTHAGAIPAGNFTVSSAKAEIHITGGGQGPLTLTGPGLVRLAELEKMLNEASALERLLDAARLDPGSRTYLFVKVLVQATLGLVQEFEETVQALKAIPKKADGSIDILTLLDAFIRPAENSGFCARQAPPSGAQPVMHLTLCALLRQAVAIADPNDLLRPILAAALDHDYRRVAIKVTDSVFSRQGIEAICCGKEANCTDIALLYGRLARTVVSYVLMAGSSEDQSIAARAAFKAAAIDVIRGIGKRGGVDRPLASWRSVWIPTGTLRASWSTSYQQVDVRGNGIRFAPTVDWPTLRARLTLDGSTAYLGLAFSVLDALAPFTEAVSRNRSLVYRHENDVAWLTAINPRISGLLALPALTKNTALVVSAGLRFAAPYDIGGSAEQSHLFSYAPLWGNQQTNDHGVSLGDRMWQSVELSAGIQYVP